MASCCGTSAQSRQQLGFVRISLCGDGRGCPDFSGGQVRFTQEFRDNLTALLAAAGRTSTPVIVSLLDYYFCSTPRRVDGVQLGHCAFLQSDVGRRAFLAALQPVLQEHQGDPSIKSIEIGHELDWLVPEINGGLQPSGVPAGVTFERLTLADLQSFLRDAASLIHEYSKRPASVSSARLGWLQYYSNLGLDSYIASSQFQGDPFPFPKASDLGVSGPVYVSVPTGGSARAFGEYIESASSQGYAGVVAYSLRGGDSFSNLPAAIQDLVGRTPTLTVQGIVNAASGRSGPVAPSSWVTIFGGGLALTAVTASTVPLPCSLGSSVVTVTARGREVCAPILYASPGQINVLMPADLPVGPANLRLRRTDGGAATANMTIAATSPGLFRIPGSGTRPAAGFAILPDGTRSPLFDCPTTGQCTTKPIDLPAGGGLILELYGTGFRGAATGTVQATVGGSTATVQYAGASDGLGLDQLNLQLPTGFARTGEQDVVLTVAGVSSNAVVVNFRSMQTAGNERLYERLADIVRGWVAAEDLARPDGYVYAIDTGQLLQFATLDKNRRLYEALRSLSIEHLIKNNPSDPFTQGFVAWRYRSGQALDASGTTEALDLAHGLWLGAQAFNDPKDRDLALLILRGYARHATVDQGVWLIRNYFNFGTRSFATNSFLVDYDADFLEEVARTTGDPELHQVSQNSVNLVRQAATRNGLVHSIVQPEIATVYPELGFVAFSPNNVAHLGNTCEVALRTKTGAPDIAAAVLKFASQRMPDLKTYYDAATSQPVADLAAGPSTVGCLVRLAVKLGEPPGAFLSRLTEQLASFVNRPFGLRLYNATQFLLALQAANM